MELESEIPFPAELLTVPFLERELVRAVVIVKQTFDIGTDGSLARSDEQQAITPRTVRTPFGVLTGDMFFRKEGVDVCVLGTVRRATPVSEACLAVRVGGLRRTLRVFGERRWLRGMGALRPSPPSPFTEIPLGYSHAFGGAARFERQRAVWPDNPDGIGLYLSAQHAEGNRLPHIEDADARPIADWKDRPPVAGWGPYPFEWGLRLRGAVLNEGDDGPRLRPTVKMFNNAHPSLVVARLDAKTPIELEGVSDRSLQFSIPETVPRVNVRVGFKERTLSAALDGVFIWTDPRKVVFTYRARFEYPLQRGDERRVAVFMGAEPGLARAG